LGRGFLLVGLIVLGWAAATIIVAALTTWWVLFALFALFPLAMASSMAVIGATGPAQGGPRAWCAWCFGSTDRESGKQPTPQH